MILHHNLIDIPNKEIYPAKIEVANGKIISIEKTSETCEGYILPGFIDAHIHIESSMLLPSAFAKIAVQHGTVATVSDPHEIANVCGIDGIDYMINNGNKVPFHFFFGAPSCVPATGFETSGAVINSNQINELLSRKEILYLSELMNYPGVLFEDPEVIKKIAFAKKHNKPIDGHAPGLLHDQAEKYIHAGISTDHECFTKEEALGKLKHGMKILIREGSAAKNFEALIDLLNDYEDEIMFCCDDKHPDELLLHHINHHVKRALDKGIDLFKVLKAACINPTKHYNLPVGLLLEGDSADFITIDNPTDFNILSTYIKGACVFENGESKIPVIKEEPINQFNCKKIEVNDLEIEANGHEKIKVIEALDGQLITNSKTAHAKLENGNLVSDTENDILKMVVLNRYQDAPIAVAFIKNVGLKKGAIASTVAHDCHNIICVGANDEAMCAAINALIDSKGGVCVSNDEKVETLPLPIAGLMSLQSAEEVGKAYSKLDKLTKELGSTLSAPFMTLSFMALLVIPNLKLSDKGLFDGEKFEFTHLFIQ
jgi:adenine deaminase